MKINVKINGLDSLMNDLKKLGPEKQTQIMDKGLMQGGEIIKKQAVANAPKKTRRLANAIRVRKSTLRTPGKSKITVEVGGKGAWKGDEFYGFFQEEGFHIGKRVRRKDPRTHRWVKDTRKMIPGKHYMTGAFEEVGEQAMNTAVTTMESELDKAGL